MGCSTAFGEQDGDTTLPYLEAVLRAEVQEVGQLVPADAEADLRKTSTAGESKAATYWGRRIDETGTNQDQDAPKTRVQSSTTNLQPPTEADMPLAPAWDGPIGPTGMTCDMTRT